MKILGIESSCDETAAAVVQDGQLLFSSIVASSMGAHVEYGGVVPEVAARHQIESIIPVINQALNQAQLQLDDLDGIAVSNGPGLSGSLLVGTLTARTLAISNDLPLYGVDHVKAHVYANFLTKSRLKNFIMPSKVPTFPMLALIVSGGHTQLVVFKDHFDYQLLGQTADDAIGEAFDKVAKLMGMDYPGGPNIERKAKQGDPFKYQLPIAKLEGKYDFSFSGLKTAVLRLAQSLVEEDYTFPSSLLSDRLNEAQKADISASFLRVAIQTVVDKTLLAYQAYRPSSVVIAGGVAANKELRAQLSARLPIEIAYADPKLCTDNAAMIATLGCFIHGTKEKPADPYSLSIQPALSM